MCAIASLLHQIKVMLANIKNQMRVKNFKLKTKETKHVKKERTEKMVLILYSTLMVLPSIC